MVAVSEVLAACVRHARMSSYRRDQSVTECVHSRAPRLARMEHCESVTMRRRVVGGFVTDRPGA